MHLTIVDDSEENLRSYKHLLEGSFSLELIQSPINIFEFLSKNSTDLIILDLHMPQMNGFDLYKKVRELYDTPIIFLSADPSEEAMIEGLNLGAEDFISKPVSVKELVARITNKVQKESSKNSKNNIIEYDGLKIYCDLQSVDIDGQNIQLTPIEYKLLYLLAQHPNEIFSREHITKTLWPNMSVQNQNIDTHLSNLRKKTYPFSKRIKTIKSRGYVLRD